MHKYNLVYIGGNVRQSLNKFVLFLYLSWLSDFDLRI